jgi:hypothetical protein
MSVPLWWLDLGISVPKFYSRRRSNKYLGLKYYGLKRLISRERESSNLNLMDYYIWRKTKHSSARTRTPVHERSWDWDSTVSF